MASWWIEKIRITGTSILNPIPSRYPNNSLLSSLLSIYTLYTTRQPHKKVQQQASPLRARERERGRKGGREEEGRKRGTRKGRMEYTQPAVAVNLLACVITSLISVVGTGFGNGNGSANVSGRDSAALQMLRLEGRVDLLHTHVAAKDFGNNLSVNPVAVVYPSSVSDIATVVRSAFACECDLTVAAKGHGHSLNGQAMAEKGIVINMESLGEGNIDVDAKRLFVDVNGGHLWIDVLRATLKHGLAPKSWTDYLYLTVGGTLSNAGISGQTFRHGPQITNVLQLQVVTGKGEVVTCSKDSKAKLFYGVLGGLGQFGIITRARISLEPAPHRVKWIRVLYLDFKVFTEDQERLISADKEGELTFDYIEGFVIVNNKALVNHWRSSFFSPQNPVKVSSLSTKDRVLYCLEVAFNYFNIHNSSKIDEDVAFLLARLRFIPESVFTSDVSYMEFLNRVHRSEIKLQEKGQWDVPHPWLNIFIPSSKIHVFEAKVFRDILHGTNAGPILIYPMNTHKWDKRMSAVVPEEENIFYVVGLLRSALSRSSLESLIDQNTRILEMCNKSALKAKQYLPHYTSEEEWQIHFGDKWERFLDLKNTYDPRHILAPGQNIFQRTSSQSSVSATC